MTRGTVTSRMRRAAHPSGCARCGAGADCSEINTNLSTSGVGFVLWKRLAIHVGKATDSHWTSVWVLQGGTFYFDQRLLAALSLHSAESCMQG